MRLAQIIGLKRFRRLSAWGGHANQAADRHLIPIKGRAGVNEYNIHLIGLDKIRIGLEFGESLS